MAVKYSVDRVSRIQQPSLPPEKNLPIGNGKGKVVGPTDSGCALW